MAKAHTSQSGISNAAVHPKVVTPPRSGWHRPKSSDATRPSTPTTTTDIARRVRYKTPTSYTGEQAARADYPTTSYEFATRQYGGGIPTTQSETNSDSSVVSGLTSNLASNQRAPSRRTIRNPVVTYQNRTKDNAPDRDRSSATPRTTATPSTTRSTYNTGLRPTPQPRSRRKKRGVKRIAATAYKLAARTSLLGTYAWTGSFCAFIQMPLAILATVSIGIVLGIEVLVGNGITKDIFDATVASFGANWDFKLAAFMCYVALIGFCYLQLAGIWLQCSLTGMQPTSGQGGGLKFATLLACLILYWIPLINILPISWLWVFSISLYPR